MKNFLVFLFLSLSISVTAQFQVPNARMWMYDNAEQLPLYSWGINQQIGYAYATGGTQNPPNQDPRANVTVSSTYARKGTYSYKMHLEKRTDYPACCEWVRTEWMWLSPSQQTLSNEWRWAGISILIAPSVQFENRPMLIAYDHKESPDDLQTPWGLLIQNGRYIWSSGRYAPNGGYDLGPVEKGVWEDWLLERNWSAGSNGYLRLYRNGQIVVNHTGPNADGRSGVAPICRIQHGIYKWAWATAGGQGYGEGYPLEAANAPIDIYMDEIRFGKTTATLNDMLVDGGSGNSVPTANAGADKFITLPATSSSLTGSGTDTDGTIASYLWTQSSNNPVAASIVSSTLATTTITGMTVAGTYVFTLKVTDNLGASATDNVAITVNPATVPNAPPNAYAGDNVIQTLPNDSYIFGTVGPGAAAASDPEGGPLSYQWTLLHGTATLANANQLALTISDMTADYYTLRLTVTDNTGQTGTDTVNITVLPEPVPPNPPIAIVGGVNSPILPLDSIQVNGTASYVEEDSIIAYNWSRVSGPAGFAVRNQGSPVTYIYDLDAGTYVMRLIVIAGNTKEDTVDFTVVVQPAPISNDPPEIDSMDLIIVNLPTVTTPGTATLTVHATDPDGSITSYQWGQVSGPTTGTLGTPTDSTTQALNLVTGTYVFFVTVYDDQQLSSTATVTVYVRQPLRQGKYSLKFKKRT